MENLSFSENLTENITANDDLECSSELQDFCEYVTMFRSKEIAMKYLARKLLTKPYLFCFFGSFVAVVGCVSMIVNMKIILLFPRVFSSREKWAENWNLLSLTVADLGMCCSTFPHIFYSAIRGGWNFGIKACIFDGMAGAIFSGAQIWSLTATAVERYKVIRKIWKKTPSSKNLVVGLAIIWGIPISTAVMPLFGFGRYMPDGIFISCTFNYIEQDPNNVIYVVILIFIYLIVPVLIILRYYTGIIQATHRNSSDLLRFANADKGANSERMRQREIYLIRTICIIVGCFLASWMPYTIIAVLSLSGYRVSNIAATCAALFAKASTVLNAALYTALHPKYKTIIWKKTKPGFSKQDSRRTRSSSSNSSKESTRRLRFTAKETEQEVQL